MDKDLSAMGLGVRSMRYSMIVKAGVVKSVNIDRDGRVKLSSAAELLSKL